MASIVRPSLLRQACSAAPTARMLSTRASINASQRIAQPSFVRSAVPTPMKAAAFHASAKRAILPPGPQHVEGTANDPVPVPPAEPTHGSYHWTFERILAAGLIPLTVAPFAAGTQHPVLDATLCASLLIHSHIGFDSMVIDYIPKKRFPKSRALFTWGLRAGTVVVAIGLYEFETNDVGLTEAIKRVWTA
ncbi:mitochondrial succinate dehydrogenase cytochrome b560 subunit D [Xylona heveae TC161]|uniref:Succinate dehydrogenase [ubiquinone] cytochrome b small subunit n=1 Tax=Xylona heveae (strain CBS 132557 / TC161) TaxID=1328760 RepID=A0A165GCD3_XYLHT|nr:mitochondrial succinate dehydrogenase cytochrome b560 subunit D [Xylona heveae TC161]KZF22022.1 mitochondrial succinate dehydrogenase cytochrome b560 subunit D [Xylona heveae TC161]